MNYNAFRIQNSQKQSNLIVTKLKLVNLNYILDYKLVIEKILKLVIRQVLMIYMLYSALKSMLYLHIVHNFKNLLYIFSTIFSVIICEYK